MIMAMTQLIEMSRRYGADARYVLAGGGNTSWKNDGTIWVKASGAPLATIDAEDFVGLDCERLLQTLYKAYPDQDAMREAAVLEDILAARLESQQDKRPSVECVLHALLPYRYVLHVHPALVNGLTCSRNGAQQCAALLGGGVLWVPLTKPGYVLSKRCQELFQAFKQEKGGCPNIVLLQNHGIFVAADSTEEIDRITADIMEKLEQAQQAQPDFSPADLPAEAAKILPVLRMLYGTPDSLASGRYFCNRAVLDFSKNMSSMLALMRPFSPDQIVYCKAAPLYIESYDSAGGTAALESALASFQNKNGYVPRIVIVKDVGAFALGKNPKETDAAAQVFLDAVKIAVYAQSFGGPLGLPDEFTEFILAWEVESYRQSLLSQGSTPKKMRGKICIVTGAAQGFGEGIARAIAAEGGYVTIADLNAGAAQTVADDLNLRYGPGSAVAVAADVTDAASVQNMVTRTVLERGGLDVMISCAGVLIAGDVTAMTKKQFDLVTQVNYTGYFLCVKYTSEPMKIQRAAAPYYTGDIIEINSKSGLEGSKNNFAYAGSKFGGIGLTQSFALELVDCGIKVNAICPGNFLDGPLWSDPEKGLFRQYLDAGKVPGAKTVEEVRQFYEAKVPMKRGCAIEDVVRAIFYVIEQQYETGQAVPVTGGQNMLR